MPDPKFRNFVSSMLPDPPKLGRFRRYNFSSPRAYTFKISLYAPVKRPLFSIACEQALHLGDIVKSTRASGKRGETRQLRSSKWRACWQVMLSSISNDAAIWCLCTSQILVIALLASFFYIFFSIDEVCSDFFNPLLLDHRCELC